MNNLYIIIHNLLLILLIIVKLFICLVMLLNISRWDNRTSGRFKEKLLI